MLQKTKTPLIPLLLLSTLLFLLYHRTFIWLVNEWLTNPYYSHGFLIPPVSLFIAWLRRKEADARDRKFKGASAILGFGLLILVIGFLYGMNVVVALSLIPVTIGLLLHLCPSKKKTIVFPLLFLFFAVPIPIERAGFALQTISASASASLLSSLGLNVSRHGVQLCLENGSFFVGEPCSGMQTLVSLLALAALLAYFMHCCLIKKLSLFFSAIPLAVTANTFRLCTIIIVFAACLSGNTNTVLLFHALSSILMFGFALVLFISSAKLLKCEVMLR
ncbi:MAG: exosortase/archaeosortase family protein [Methanophagales archaeon]|nr:exosortase/archaeosortase family protein [Methanophagales archaeon]